VSEKAGLPKVMVPPVVLATVTVSAVVLPLGNVRLLGLTVTGAGLAVAPGVAATATTGSIANVAPKTAGNRKRATLTPPRTLV
jgi:hypothetical protein